MTSVAVARLGPTAAETARIRMRGGKAKRTSITPMITLSR
jgi:hypothetical protein